MTAEEKVRYVQTDSRGRATLRLEPGRVYRRTTHPDGRIVLEPARILTAREIDELTAPRDVGVVDSEEDALKMASAWSDYRAEYGASGQAAHDEFEAGWDAARRGFDILRGASTDFRAGYDAAKGTLDIGGVQR